MLKTRLLALIVLLFTFFSSLTYGASASENRLIDIVSITWSGAPNIQTRMSEIEQSINREVNSAWRSFTKIEGDTKGREINFSHGRTLDELLVLSRPMACSGSSASSFMSSIRIETYKKLGITDWSNRYLVILTPNIGCIWMGKALIGSNKYPGGVLSLQDTSSSFVITHELGHTLGLGHSNFLRCESGARDGAWSNDCKGVEYGGTIDVMGNVATSSFLSTYHQWRMGLLDNEEIHQAFTSDEIELSAADIIDRTRVIFIRDGRSTYWIEYRRASVANSFNPGLVIFRTDPPPSSAVITPNTDQVISDSSLEVGSDVWMLNWDNYRYVGSRASGSMTLPTGSSATFFSGKVSITASTSDSSDKVIVKVIMQSENNPPPTPVLTDPDSWKFPGVEVIDKGYDDGESAIRDFQATIDGIQIDLPSSIPDRWTPTYLNPLAAPKTVFVRDLPEGNYMLSIRAIDVWGNKSQWSKPIKVSIDRGYPELRPNVSIDAIKAGEIDIRLTGAKDVGSGLCLTQWVNQEGFVLERSVEKSTPKFSFPINSSIEAKLHVYDCLGNGIVTDVKLADEYLAVSSSKRTGKWVNTKLGNIDAMRCIGKCSASFSTRGSVTVLAGAGNPEIYVTSKKQFSIPPSSIESLRLGTSIDLGLRNKVLRISGTNFTLAGVARIDFRLSEIKQTSLIESEIDESLVNPIQKELNKLGFNQKDFSSEWSVKPMQRGTSLLDPTLDLCKIAYSSDSERQSRRQISITKAESDYLFLSSEVVKYKSELAATNAKSELVRAIESCRLNKGFIDVTGKSVNHDFLAIPIEVERVVKERRQIVVHIGISNNGSPMNLLAFYQFLGANYTGLYVVRPASSPFKPEEISRWNQVALRLWQRMQMSA